MTGDIYGTGLFKKETRIVDDHTMTNIRYIILAKTKRLTF